jgi:uncharacterized phage protein (TIGR02220 family)
VSDETDMFDLLWARMEAADKRYVWKKIKREAAAVKNEKHRDSAIEILTFLNNKAGRNYRQSDTNLGYIIARLADSISPEQLRAIVVRKCREWGEDKRMSQYLRPATLFNKEKCEQYLGEMGNLS